MQAFGTSVCTMASSDLLNLGNIAVALPVSSINCLPLEEDDTVASFGALSEWTTEQVFIIIVSPAKHGPYRDHDSVGGVRVSHFWFPINNF